jgi:hypothetical protein
MLDKIEFDKVEIASLPLGQGNVLVVKYPDEWADECRFGFDEPVSVSEREYFALIRNRLLNMASEAVESSGLSDVGLMLVPKCVDIQIVRREDIAEIAPKDGK